MARHAVALGLTGLLVVFAVLLVVLPYVQKWFLNKSVMGFEDLTCEEGAKPCPEGYFCEQKTCVQILPSYNVDQVQPGSH